MNSLFLLLFFLSLLLLIVGLVNPRLVIKWGEVENRSRKKVFAFYGIGLIAFFILFGVTSESSTEEVADSDSEENTKVEEVEEVEEVVTKEKSEPVVKELTAEEKAAKEQEERMSYETGITYDQLARTPDNFVDEKTKFNGEVLQVIEGGDETELRIAVNDNYDKVIYVWYDSSITDTRVLEGDNVTIRGISQGLITYESTMGGQISIPSMLVKNIEISQ